LKRWRRAGFLPLSVVTLISAALLVPLPFYLERPGQTVSLAACIDVAADSPRVDGDFLLTTINVIPATAVDVARGFAEDDAAIVPRRQLLPPGVDPAEFFSRQREVFSNSAEIAAAVGLDAAGYDVTFTGDGVQVARILPNTPAAAELQPGDVIRAIDGTPITVESELRAAIAAAAAGEPLRLQVHRGGDVLDIDVAPELIQGVPVIGILPQTLDPRVSLPVEIDVATGPIGGPSAGLMIALTVFDKVLPDVDLAAGRLIAGTGSISQDGRVGPVGGVGLKVLAADARGADVFLAPLADHASALAAVPAGSSLRIVPVETFTQARDALLETAGEASRTQPDQSPDCPFADNGEAAPSVGAGLPAAMRP
jgi:Lon-like protease